MKRRQRCVWPGLLSIERTVIQVVETFLCVEDNMDIPAMVRGCQACGVEDPMDARTYSVGTWEISSLPSATGGAAKVKAGAKRRMHGEERSDTAIRAMKLANKAWRTTWRSWWSKGPYPRGNRKLRHTPDTGPEVV